MKKLFIIALRTLPRPFLIRMSYVIRPVLAFFMKGNRYTDPISGQSFRAFLPYGYDRKRENVLSPGTLSLERHRLLWLYLQNETPFFSAPLKVLHFAPEQAFHKRFRKLKHLQYLTTDLDSPLADVKADICNLPFKENEFDVILCNHVLEHIEEDKKAMKELYRVMKPGGWGIFQVPQDHALEVTFENPDITHPKERTRVFGQYDHVRIYGRDYADKLRSVGFKVDEIHYSSQLTPELYTRYVLNKKDYITLCRKPEKS